MKRKDEILCYGFNETVIGNTTALHYSFAFNQIPILAVIYTESEDAAIRGLNYDELIKEACTYIYLHYMIIGSRLR